MHHSDNGEFIRWESGFRNWVTPDGSPGLSGEGGFPAEPGRYHLYVSYACPWAHRTLIVRALKGLEELISVSVVHPLMPPESWVFGEYPGATPDHLHGFDKLQQLYQHSAPDFDGVVTVPVLYDKQRQTIVNNESSEIIRMLNSAFDAWGNAELDLYPVELRAEIDAINALVYDNINNGVYRAGFATTQAAYEDAFDKLFAALDQLEARLATQRYLVGDRITEADWRLFTTLVRFDPVYHGHFKCNRQRLIDYPNLWAYTRELYQVPGIAETLNMDHIKRHYYGSHKQLNPTGIVPKGPELDLQMSSRRHDLAADHAPQNVTKRS
ncbi:glutathione S-transferase family protein [Halochromatium roseum]|uniref:glutathione S-transferase family protein n=1 Tax=Halochromatium roseum TaxID=391920 RepID=UPI0019135F12|nr:glutathione S-transferase family protein [Halochromatium roseum]MBK5940869.1 glutathione-dependent reductase [Halochromatium roseum]